MKIINAFIILIIFSTSFCAPGEKTEDKKPKLIKIRYDKDRKPHEQYYIPVEKVKPGQQIELTVDQESFETMGIKTPVTFIIPRADELFNTDDNYDAYPSVRIGGVTYLFINMSSVENRISKVLTINVHPNLKPGEKLRYPFTVYLKDVRELGDGDSSPAIIVEP